MTTPLRILSLSDIHLGHRLVPAEHIISSLNKVLHNSEKMQNIDIIFLCGDVWDEGLLLSDPEVGLIQIWIVNLLKLCKRYNILLRVLDGTNSHDRNQSQQFEILNTSLEINANLKYHDKLEIDFISEFNIHVLYLPDEWRGDNEQTKAEVKELLLAANLVQVDYGVFHGNFQHQLPATIKHLAFHDHEFYLSIVKKYIFIGHIHIMSVFERILAQGSFERLAHGEEHNKGLFYVEAYPDNELNDKIVFIVNKNATKFISISIIDLTKHAVELLLKSTIRKVTDNNEDYTIPVHIRVISDKHNSNDDIVNSYKKSYVFIKWTHKVLLVKTENTTIVPNVYVPVAITNNTIMSLIKTRLISAGTEEHLVTNALNKLNILKGV